MRSVLTQPKPIQIDTSHYSGSISQIHRLPEFCDPRTLSDLIEGNQICASLSGKTVAVIVVKSETCEFIDHNIPRIAKPAFARWLNGQRVETRILDLRDDRLLVWGLHRSFCIPGVYECSQFGVRLVHPLSRITSFHRAQNSFVLIGGAKKASEEHMFTEYGVLPLDHLIAFNTLYDNSVLILEEVNKTAFRYSLGKSGFEDWFPIPQIRGEKPFAIARIGRQCVLGTHSKSGSHIRLLGGNTFPFPLQEDWEGKIEYLWQSPDERSLVWLVRPNRKKTHRQLYLNGTLLYEGSFLMGQRDLVWSPQSESFGARILSFDDDGQNRQIIITPIIHLKMPTGSLVREFLVDDVGHISAHILDSGYFCYPYIHDRPHTAVGLAWNLHWMNTGGIGYNSVLSSYVYHTSDETHLVR